MFECRILWLWKTLFSKSDIPKSLFFVCKPVYSIPSSGHSFELKVPRNIVDFGNKHLKNEYVSALSHVIDIYWWGKDELEWTELLKILFVKHKHHDKLTHFCFHGTMLIDTFVTKFHSQSIAWTHFSQAHSLPFFLTRWTRKMKFLFKSLELHTVYPTKALR